MLEESDPLELKLFGSCEPPGMAAGDTTQVLCSRPWSCLSSPVDYMFMRRTLLINFPLN